MDENEKYTKPQLEFIMQNYKNIEEYEKENEVKRAYMYLKDTDYVVIKLYEYYLLDEYSKINLDEYDETFKKREECRELIRQYEQQKQKGLAGVETK